MSGACIRVGVISDTHGLLRPEACAALAGVHHVLHAGDIGADWLLERLRAIAPVAAVRGNNDRDEWAAALPEVVDLELGGIPIRVIHDLDDLARYPHPGTPRIVVSGHSHRPRVREQDGVLYLNPGSAGPRRFKLPVSIALIDLEQSVAWARIVELEIDSKGRPVGL